MGFTPPHHRQPFHTRALLSYTAEPCLGTGACLQAQQEAQVPLPSFQQAWGRDTRELWAKQAELSQKILLPGTAQNESANHFVSSSALLSLLTPDPAALTGGISCRNSAARTSEDIIRAAVSRCHHCYLAGSHPGVSLCIKPNLGVSDC